MIVSLSARLGSGRPKFEIEIISVEAVGGLGLARRTSATSKPWLDCPYNVLRDPILKVENVLNVTFEAVAPKMRPGAHRLAGP